MDLFLLELGQLTAEFDGTFLVELLLLCLLMVVGLYVVYTDLRFRDIPPMAVWLLLACGLAGQLALWSLGKTDLAQIGLLVVASFGVGFLLYVYGFWAAGDAKLFWAIAVAFPPTLSFAPGLGSLHAPLWALLINAVLTNFFFLLGWVLLRRKQVTADRPRLPGADVWLGLGRDTAAVTGLAAGGGLLVLGSPLQFVTAVAMVVVGGLVWQRLVPLSLRTVLVLPCLGLAVYASLAPKSWPVVLALWGAGWLILAIHALIRVRFGDALVQALPIEALQTGMVPAAAICAAPHPEQKASPFVCVDHPGAKRHTLCRPGVALTDKELTRLRTLAAEGSFAAFGARLPVETPVPFAPFLVLSVVLTAVLASHLGFAFMRLLRQLWG